LSTSFGWARGFPDGCIDPDHPNPDRTSSPHTGHGLCKVCYNRRKRQEDRGEQVTPLPIPDVGESGDAVVQADADAPVLGDVQDGGPLDPPIGTQGERRPGSGASPPTAPASADSEGAPRSTIRQKLFGRKDERSSDIAVPVVKPTKEKRPGGTSLRGRVSAADTISDIWQAGGSLAARSPRHVPLGRYMQYQAPVAGEMLDDAVKGSVIDKLVLQRVVKARGRFDIATAVLGPPLLILALENNPGLAPTLMPLLESSIRNSLPLMVPALKKIKAKEKAATDAAWELFENDPDFDPNEDPVKQILEMIFAEWVPPQPVYAETVPDEEPVVA